MAPQRSILDTEAVREFCRRHRIRRLALLGSALRGELTPQSDIDVLVEFEPGATVGLITLAQMEAELTALVGRRVDLRTPAELSPYFRDEVLADARVEYAQG